MRLNEDVSSTHNLAAWALAVRDRGVVEELSALLQTPVADHGVVHRCNLFKNCIGYAMFRLNKGQEGLMLLVGRLLAFV